MILENKLGITDSVELAKAEEKISKKRAIELFESGYLNYLKPGTFKSLAEIHKYLFGPIYGFAGQIRTVNISKGNFRFAPIMYLEAALENIEKMPQSTYDEIIEKYTSLGRETDEVYVNEVLPFKMKYNLEAITSFYFIKEISVMISTVVKV